jgi:type VI secretion system secreted protein VgrG
VSQSHAGTNYGVIDIPRVGDEVIVSFLEGDPDRPIITGRVYHARNMPPYPLPDQKTITGIRSKTYRGDGYNEMIVDDTPGNELIRIHAQFDLDTTVLNDQRERVVRDRTRSVGRDEVVTIDRDRTETIWNRDCQKVAVERDVWIGGGFNTFVGGEMNELVVISRSEETLGFKTEYVGAFVYEEIRRSKKMKIGRDVDLIVGRHLRESIDGQRTTIVKQDVIETFQADHHETVEQSYRLKAREIHIEADEAIVLKVGDTCMRLAPDTLRAMSDDTDIQGKNVSLGSLSGDVMVTASSQLNMGGDTFSLQGRSEGKINAGIVKINC